MKLRELAQGTRAVNPVELPLANVAERKAEGADQPPPDSVRVGVRCISGEETADILAAARAFAKSRGVDDPGNGEPLYDLGLQVHTLLVAVVDLDHPQPESQSARFFDSVDQILQSPLIGRDGIQYLYEAWDTWQAITSPQADTLDLPGMTSVLADLAKAEEEGDRPKALSIYLRLAPGLRVSLLLFTAAQFWSSLTGKSPTGSESESDGPISRNETEKSEPSSPDGEP